MSDVLIDPNILTDIFRGVPDAGAYLRGLVAAGTGLIHAFSHAELIGGVRDARELRMADALVATFRTVLPTAEDAEDGIQLLRANRLAHGLDFGDAMIAATALRLKAEVVTLNLKHFRFIPNLQFSRPY